MRAFGLTDNSQVSGPGWLDEERFDIIAKVPEGATKEQADSMLQNLLVTRFGMALHHETKQIQVYELTISKQGAKLKQADPTIQSSSAATNPGDLRTLDKDGFPRVPPGRTYSNGVRVEGRQRSRFGLTTMNQFAGFLARQIGQPVVDKTGLTGQYDFTLEYSPEGLAGQAYTCAQCQVQETSLDQGGPSLYAAVQQQLGLVLEGKKAPLDVLVIDKITKTPVEN